MFVHTQSTHMTGILQMWSRLTLVNVNVSLIFTNSYSHQLHFLRGLKDSLATLNFIA